MDQSTSHSHKKAGRRGLIFALVILLLLTIGVSAWLFTKYRQALQQPDQERIQIIRRISPIIALPTEQPSLSTVVDKTKLTSTALKNITQNQDKLLIYPKAKRVIVYRPSTGKVVDMLTIQAEQTKTTANQQSINP